MTVCGNRIDDPGSFRSCNSETGEGCRCSAEVKADLADHVAREQQDDLEDTR